MTYELAPKKLKAATLLANGESITSTAEQVSVARPTVHGWLRNDYTFVAYLNKLKDDNLTNARTKIQSASSLAVDTLVNVMTNSKSDTARIQAAKEVLSLAGFTKETLELFAWGVGSTSPKGVAKEMGGGEELAQIIKNLNKQVDDMTSHPTEEA